MGKMVVTTNMLISCVVATKKVNLFLHFYRICGKFCGLLLRSFSNFFVQTLTNRVELAVTTQYSHKCEPIMPIRMVVVPAILTFTQLF